MVGNPLDTDLNASPYFDDYDFEKGYNRILFKPSVPVQARELTQLQSILQKQIEIFGQNILKDGTIISGVNFTKKFFQYVKVEDRNQAGDVFSIGDYANGYLVYEATSGNANNNLIMQIELTRSGFQTQNPNLNTFYGRYTSVGKTAGGTEVEKFATGNVLKFYSANGIINSISIANSGTGYTNGDTLVFTSLRGSNAAANVTTDASGNITSVTVTNSGKNYDLRETITITVNTNTGSGANLSALLLSNTSFVAANSSLQKADPGKINYLLGTGPTEAARAEYLRHNVIGSTVGFVCDDGVIFQKGHFVDVDPQKILVDRYTTLANNYYVGFTTKEEIISSDIDSTLLDNAQGFNNVNASGADRLKLSAVANSFVSSNAPNNFLRIVEVNSKGDINRIQEETVYSQLGKEMARRTHEESGNYVVKPFTFSSEDLTSNATHDTVLVGTGKAYVQGFRTETVGTSRVTVRKGTDTANVENAVVSQNFGNYVIVDEYLGNFGIETNSEVKLLDTASNRISTCPTASDETIPSISGSNVSGSGPSYTGVVVGTAKVRSIRYNSGVQGTSTCQYRVYLFDIQMNAGKDFRDIKSIAEFAGGGSGEAIADTVLVNGNTVLNETDRKVLVQSFSNKGIKTLNHKPTDNASFIFRTTTTSQTVQTNGTLTFALSGGDQFFPYSTSSSLSDDEENEFIIVAGGDTAQTVPLTGTVQTNSDNTTIVGTGTAFIDEYRVGDTIVVDTISGSQVITGITNNTVLQVRAAPVANGTSKAHRRLFTQNKVVPLADSTTSNITIGGTGDSAIINCTRGKELEDTLTVNVVHNIRKDNAAQIDKVLNANSYVKINCSTNAAGSSGPWSLGIPDVYDIQKVYVHTTFTGIESATYDKTSDFYLDRRQEDGFYNLSYLRQTTNSTLSLSAASRILVVLRAFTKSGSNYGYFSVDSYPVDDTTNPLPADKIRTESIPVFSSPTNGQVFDLRDAIDFRPYVANTANVTEATTAAAATTNPAATKTFAGEQYNAAAGKNLVVDYQHYLPRIDMLTLSDNGIFEITEGTPQSKPVPPRPKDNVMPLCGIEVPVFPSLSAKLARQAGRIDYGYTIADKQIKRSTMQDLKQLRQDVTKLQYYTSLNSLEKDTQALTIPSSANTSLDRFKNGILVDNFSSKSPASVNDREFKAGYDSARKVLTSRIKQNRIDIAPQTFANTVQNRDLITLPYNSTTLLEQRSATKTRNTAEASWNFFGKASLFPNYDNFYDVRHAAESDIKLELDMSSGVKSLANQLNQLEAIQAPSTEVVSSESVTNFLGTTNSSRVSGATTRSTGGGTQIIEIVENETVEHYETILTEEVQEKHNQFIGTETTSVTNVGTFVKDTRFNPYIREQVIFCYAVGLKPNTRHYIYFDSKDVSAVVTPCTVNSSDEVIQSNFRTTGVRGDAINSNSKGEVFFSLYIASETYAVGSREVYIANKNTYQNAVDDADSFTTVTFNAYNHSVDQGSLEVSTKQVQFQTQRPVIGSKTIVTNTPSQKSTVVSSQSIVGFIPNPPAPPSFVPDGDGDGGDGGDDGGDDPIAQTFIVKDTQDATGVFISKIDLYFQTKDPNLGVTVELRSVLNGYPTLNQIPGSQVHLNSSQVNTSNDGSIATTVTFNDLVFLKNFTEYCIVVTPDNANPNYELFVRKAGEADFITKNVENKDSFVGSLFVSSNNSAWKATVDEDFKMTIYRANFTKGSGEVLYTNRDYEFFDLSSIQGGFEQGERVFEWDPSANITGTVQFTTTSETVTGSGTAFTTDLNVGDWVALSNGTSHDAKKVTSITSNTSLTIQGFPTFAVQGANTANVMLSAQGTVDFYENTSRNKEMFLIDSTANSTMYFANSDIIIGSQSQANAVVTTVKNLKTSGFENLIYYISPELTEFTQFAQANTATGSSANNSYPVDNRARFDEEQYIKSRSNEIVDQSGAKSWKHTYKFKTQLDRLSPILDDSTTSIVRLEHVINNDATNEYLPGQGNALAKYVSKVVTLDAGLDAEDIKVFVTSTRPQGTDVQVWARVLNEYDPDPFGDKHWTKLARVGDDSFTSPTGINDFIEMEFGFPTSLDVTKLSGTGLADLANTQISTNGTDLSTAVSTNDLLKIVNTSRTTDYQLELVSAANSTVITLANALTFDNTEADLFLVNTTAKQQAFLDPGNEGIVTYFNGDNIRFNQYRSFQIKIVMLSPDITRVPRIKNYRAIAVTI
jgi:hypothetical protein